MQRIELLGATGIGKTSLLNIIFSSRTNDDHWLTIDEAKIRIAISMDDDFPALSRRSLMKYGLF